MLKHVSKGGIVRETAMPTSADTVFSADEIASAKAWRCDNTNSKTLKGSE